MSLHSPGLKGSGRGTRVRRKGFPSEHRADTAPTSPAMCHLRLIWRCGTLRLNQSRIWFGRLTLTFCHKQSFFPPHQNQIMTKVNPKRGEMHAICQELTHETLYRQNLGLY